MKYLFAILLSLFSFIGFSQFDFLLLDKETNEPIPQTAVYAGLNTYGRTDFDGLVRFSADKDLLLDSIVFEHPNYVFDKTVVQNITGQIRPSGQILYTVFGYKKPTYLTFDIPISVSNKIAKDSVDFTVKIIDNQTIDEVEYLTNNSKRHVLLNKKNDRLFKVQLPISSIRNGYIILNQSDSILFNRSKWGETIYIDKNGINTISSETNRVNISNYLMLIKVEKVKQLELEKKKNQTIERYKDSLISCRGKNVPIKYIAPIPEEDPFFAFIKKERKISLVSSKENIINDISKKLSRLDIKKQGVVQFKVRVYQYGRSMVHLQNSVSPEHKKAAELIRHELSNLKWYFDYSGYKFKHDYVVNINLVPQ